MHTHTIETSRVVDPNAPPLRTYTSPLVRRFAREQEVDLSVIEGTGPKGRLTFADVLAYVRKD